MSKLNPSEPAQMSPSGFVLRVSDVRSAYFIAKQSGADKALKIRYIDNSTEVIHDPALAQEAHKMIADCLKEVV